MPNMEPRWGPRQGPDEPCDLDPVLSRLDSTFWCSIRRKGARCGRQAQMMATEGSMVLQMKTGSMSQVMSAAAMNTDRYQMRTILATQALELPSASALSLFWRAG